MGVRARVSFSLPLLPLFLLCAALHCLDCEQSLFFFRFSESNARARERRSRETRETREAVATCVSRVLLDRLKKKERLLVVYPLSERLYRLTAGLRDWLLPGKQPQLQRQRKRLFKTEFACYQSSSLLFHLVQFFRYWRIFLRVNC